MSLLDGIVIGEQVSTATIRNGALEATFRDNSESPGVLSGIGSLFNIESAPGFNAFDPDSPGASAGLNFEHIISGHASEHNGFSPRYGVYTMYRQPDGKSVLWYRKAEDEPWGIESTTKVTLVEPHYVDLEFRCIPTDALKFEPQDYAIFFFCSYMNDVADVPIHFPGADEDHVEKWIDGNAPPGHTDWNGGGTYRSLYAEALPYDDDHNFKLNSWSYEWPRYTKPFYYGLAGNGMVYIQMFDKSWSPEDEIRFSIFKFKLKDFPRPAWDYEYIVRKLETGRKYGYRMRAVWKKFVSPEDCRSEYENWISGR